MTSDIRSRTASKATFDPRGIDGKLIECLEAFELWLSREPWNYDYVSAKAGWLGAWFRADRPVKTDGKRDKAT